MLKSIKSLIIIACLCCAPSANAATPNDTIAVDQKDVTRFEAVESVNTKGNKTIKYYCVYKGLLLTTTKTTKEKAELCKKLGAKCALICIGKKVNGVFQPKRIVTN